MASAAVLRPEQALFRKRTFSDVDVAASERQSMSSKHAKIKTLVVSAHADLPVPTAETKDALATSRYDPSLDVPCRLGESAILSEENAGDVYLGSTTTSPRRQLPSGPKGSLAVPSMEDWPRPSDEGNTSELPGAGTSSSPDEATSCYGYFPDEDEDPRSYCEEDIARISRMLHAPSPSPEEVGAAELAPWEELQEPGSGVFDVDDVGQVLESSDSHLGYLIEASDDQLGIPPSPSAVDTSPTSSSVDLTQGAEEDFYMTFDDMPHELGEEQMAMSAAAAAPGSMFHSEHDSLERELSAVLECDSLSAAQQGGAFFEGPADDAGESNELLLQAAACLDSDSLEIAFGQFCSPAVQSDLLMSSCQ